MDYKIVCICGSTRFEKEILKHAARLTLEGYIVLMPNVFTFTGYPIDPPQKIKLDAIHLNKIGLSDEIFVVNCGGYIGKSTTREIEHAKQLGKKINYLE